MADLLADVKRVFLDTRAEFTGEALKLKQVGVCRNTDDPTKGHEWIARDPDGSYYTIESPQVQSDYTENDINSPSYILNKPLDGISATISSPTLAELQALVDSGITVFYANGNCDLPLGVINLKDDTSYHFIASTQYNKFRILHETGFHYSGTHSTVANITIKGGISLYGTLSTDNVVGSTLIEILEIEGSAHLDSGQGAGFSIESLILSSHDLYEDSSSTRAYYQYLSTSGGKILEAIAENDVTLTRQSNWLRPMDVKDFTTRKLDIDVQGKLPTDRVLTVVDKSTDTNLGSIFADGRILWGSNATIADILTGQLQVVTNLIVDGTVDIGTPTEDNGSLNVKALQTGILGHQFVVPAGSDTVGVYEVSVAVSIDYPSDAVYEFTGANDTYYMYSGKISNRKYWFVGVNILTGVYAYADCQFRQTVPSGSSQGSQDEWTPEDSSFIGINAPDTSNPASAVYLSGVAGPCINADGEVHLHNLPIGLPSGQTKAGNLAITTEGVVYFE